MAHYTRLEQTSAAFNEMIKRFGVVTVMNVDVFDTNELIAEDGLLEEGFKNLTSDEICQRLKGAAESKSDGWLCRLDTLKVANISQEGPTKTITGGQNASPLLKYGKTARLEMQDALGNIDALEALGGLVKEWVYEPASAEASGAGTEGMVAIAVHAGDQFPGPKTILGDTFFIDQKTGNQVKVAILIYQFVSDAIFNLTQDAEGDATVFDLNGDLIATEVLIGSKDGRLIGRNLFYSVVDPDHVHPGE